MPKKDRFVLFWVYGDGDDTPYIVRNPPRNFRKLVKQWNKLDNKMTNDEDEKGEWDYINVWLRKQGVDIFPASAEVILDDCR